ncbi:C-type lectin domain family 18 member B-like isoform X2 [Haliotis rufescens]|uniref:C-type lectin domain family 18 member B-like isoform X2 n=1 Tax=Haliotis rufescens TaxID=6454 RepID=UPI00201EE3EB|nr:C-type lectin domain family 18 member B-like isoform X2 [Haliotis rufescens]
MTMMLRVTLMVIVMLQGTLSLEQEYKDLLLRLHNDARADEGGSDMNQLVWDDQLEKEAGAWANGCVFEHQMKGRGENLAFNTNKNPETELTEIAFKAWFDEKNIYTYGQYSCGSSCHYTQLVWATTRRVGCAMKRCNYLSGGASNAWYLVCFYDPAGNKMGQKPYQRGGSCSKCRDDQSCSNRLCAGGADPCEDLDANCDVWANSMQQCTQNKEFMKEKCSLSCKFCKAGGKPAKGNSKQKPSGGDCADSDRRCPSWANSGYCTTRPRYMEPRCKKSCNVCGGGTSNGGKKEKVTTVKKPKTKQCRDKVRSCKRWASQNQCARNPAYMKVKCPKSCNTCYDETTCYDSHGNCRSWAEYGECDRNPGWMYKYCQRSCGQCADTSSGDRGSNSSCRDENNSCARWAKSGECKNNPRYMSKKCKKSCKTC